MNPILRSMAVSVLLMGSTSLIACGGSDGGTDPDPDPTDDTGDLVVDVTADGFPLQGATVELYASGGSTPEASQTTNSDGRASFNDLEPGAREVAIVPPAGFELDTGEQERKSVTISAGQSATRSFALLTQIDGEVVEVTLNDNLTFSPALVTIEPGTTIRWRSQSNMLHTVTPDGHSEWDETNLEQSGQIFHHTFDEEGEFDYFCLPHQAQGMVGTITVSN